MRPAPAAVSTEPWLSLMFSSLSPRPVRQAPTTHLWGWCHFLPQAAQVQVVGRELLEAHLPLGSWASTVTRTSSSLRDATGKSDRRGQLVSHGLRQLLSGQDPLSRLARSRLNRRGWRFRDEERTPRPQVDVSARTTSATFSTDTGAIEGKWLRWHRLRLRAAAAGRSRWATYSRWREPRTATDCDS